MDDPDLFPGFAMPALSDVLKVYTELYNETDYPRFHSKEVNWFPVFDSGANDYYRVRCESTRVNDGVVFYDDNEGAHRTGDVLPDVAFIGLEAMFRTILKCYETCAYNINDQGNFDHDCVQTCNSDGDLIDIDMSRYDAVVQEFNPGVK